MGVAHRPHEARQDARLTEIGMGMWGGRYYAELVPEFGEVIAAGGVLRPAPDGERYHQIAKRVSAWLGETDDDPGDRLVIMHGISSRVLRGVMTGHDVHPEFAAPIAPGLPQGSVAMIAGGVETVVHTGTGHAPA